IRQSLEPLRRVVSADNQRLRRAIERVDHSLDRLDGLVASARRLDEATADLVAEPRRPVDLPRLLGKLIESRAALLPGRDLRLRGCRSRRASPEPHHCVYPRGTGLVPAIRVFGRLATAAKRWCPDQVRARGCDKGLATSIGGGEFVG